LKKPRNCANLFQYCDEKLAKAFRRIDAGDSHNPSNNQALEDYRKTFTLEKVFLEQLHLGVVNIVANHSTNPSSSWLFRRSEGTSAFHNESEGSSLEETRSGDAEKIWVLSPDFLRAAGFATVPTSGRWRSLRAGTRRSQLYSEKKAPTRAPLPSLIHITWICPFWRRVQKRGKEKANQRKTLAIFKYMRAFDMEYNDIWRSPAGGYHGTYSNSLAFGRNKVDCRSISYSGSRFFSIVDN
jgi:hypothetical protein